MQLFGSAAKPLSASYHQCSAQSSTPTFGYMRMVVPPGEHQVPGTKVNRNFFETLVSDETFMKRDPTSAKGNIQPERI